MYGVLLVIHLIVCMALISVVLLQSGKGGGLAGGAFGGSAQTVFGGRGANDFITRATMVLGAAFFLTSLTLALLSTNSGRGGRSLLQEEARRTSAGTPATLPSPGTSPAVLPGASPGSKAPAVPNPASSGAPAAPSSAPAGPASGAAPPSGTGGASGGSSPPPPAKPPGME